jgi:phosphate transport system permease protein
MSDHLRTPDPKRFEVSRATLWFDRFMGVAIRLGGVSVIIAVFGIFYFIGKEVVPLFKAASVEKSASTSTATRPSILGVDEWGEMPFFYAGGDGVVFADLATGGRKEISLPGLAGLTVTALAYDTVHGRVALGLADGRVGSFLVGYRRDFSPDGKSQLTPTLTEEPWFALSHGTGPVTAVSYGDSGAGRVIVAQRGSPGSSSISILRLGMKRGLIGKGKLSLLEEMDASPLLASEATLIRASPNGAMVLVGCKNGEVDYFLADAAGVSKRQSFQPFGGVAPRQMDFLFGGVSLVLTGENGQQAQWSLFRKDESGERLFGETKVFPSLGEGPVIFAASQRNRTFLTGSGQEFSIRHSTSGAVRWQGKLDIVPTAAVLDAKGENFIVAAANGDARSYAIHDPHPDADWRAFFGKVWYEGGAKPIYQWQSTGGTDDFEPKFSLMPLIFGSLKGTAYALLFSVPIALLAAVFSAAFLPLEVKRVVKPVMEIMSSLPSVVLGFLAGLWLAPLLEMRVPSVILMVLFIPSSAMLIGYIWCRLPFSLRNRFDAGKEWLVVIPFLALAGFVGWQLGPLLESVFFVYKDPTTGNQVADFRLWWPQVTGTSFEQRNSLVLGFMMGFAVIPVIFTIAEDALSQMFPSPSPPPLLHWVQTAGRWSGR